MNINDGTIQMLTEDALDKLSDKATKELVKIDMKDATASQRKRMRVSLKDHTSKLGRVLTESRSKYLPHVGKKQRSKLEAEQ